MTLPIIEQRPTFSVPCGQCTDCCQSDAIFMHPECGDVASQYATEEYQGRLILQHQANGDCIYLNRATGCTIHARRPVICRELDCRMMLARFGQRRLEEMGCAKLAYAARRLNKRMDRIEGEQP